MLAASQGLAVVVLAHQRKSGGKYGEGVRGSNAITGSVDIVVELERVQADEQARVLRAIGRSRSTPEQTVLKLTDRTYHVEDSLAALRAEKQAEHVLAAMEGEMTAAEIAELLDMSPATTTRRLHMLVERGLIEQAGGGGVKGSPIRWRPSFDSSSTSLLVDETNKNPPELPL
jgi:DNA-binding transcriptional ArsR family regulator